MDFMKRIKVSLAMNTNLKFFILLGFTSITSFFLLHSEKPVKPAT